MQLRSMVNGSVVAFLLFGAAAGPDGLEAQDFPLAPQRPNDQAISPFMEGWYENEDGTYTISFGYLNRNRDRVVRLPEGPENSIEPDVFSGMQPTVFHTGRHRGVFSVTLPADRADEDVWWAITNRTRATPNGEVHEVPGRTRSSAYELDYNVRPQGSVHPILWFEDGGERGRAISGVVSDRVLDATVGSPVELTVHASDPSERDPDDPRFRDGIPLRVTWILHRGPGEVEFTRHESTLAESEAVPEDDDVDVDADGSEGGGPGPEIVMLPEGEGTARVYARFSEPGEYVVRAQVDNFNAPDSSFGNQCCWSNGFVRVSVSP